MVSSCNLHHRRLEFDSESLGLLVLVSVLRVSVCRLVAASLLFLISSTQHRKKNYYILVLRRTVMLYSQLGSGSGRVGTGDDAGDGTRLFS